MPRRARARRRARRVPPSSQLRAATRPSCSMDGVAAVRPWPAVALNSTPLRSVPPLPLAPVLQRCGLGPGAGLGLGGRVRLSRSTPGSAGTGVGGCAGWSRTSLRNEPRPSAPPRSRSSSPTRALAPHCARAARARSRRIDRTKMTIPTSSASAVVRARHKATRATPREFRAQARSRSAQLTWRGCMPAIGSITLVSRSGIQHQLASPVRGPRQVHCGLRVAASVRRYAWRPIRYSAICRGARGSRLALAPGNRPAARAAHKLVAESGKPLAHLLHHRCGARSTKLLLPARLAVLDLGFV